ncbi:MAG TPA: hypothetical protein VNT56_06110 [Acidimicrobiales bacterium]|nr:hypothetical protein [Acidimicrobiales bacterium]
MKQSAFTIFAPVADGRVDPLVNLLDTIGTDIKGNPHVRFAELVDLHYASFFVMGASEGDPHLVFEGNVDGDVEMFLAHLLTHARAAVDRIFGHCIDYPSAGQAGVEARLRYLRSHDIGSDTFYVAWPGRTVCDIRREQRLRDHVQAVLDDGDRLGWRQRSPGEILQEVVGGLPADLGWARSVAPVPFLVARGRAVLAALLAPAGLGLLGLVRAAGRSSRPGRARTARVTLAAVVGGLGSLAWKLRREEAADDAADRRRQPGWQEVYARWTETEELSGIVASEDRKGQNHMVSVTQIKAGWFRLAVLRVVLWSVDIIARLSANRGRLGGIASIHFARWVITPDRRQLIFMSNFDGSWESYLNDFIDLAAVGLTAVWTNTTNAVGFPRTRWLVREGARDEARFKAFARYSMVPTTVWYSAYPEISIANIANNRAIRDGLAPARGDAGAGAWLEQL